WPYRSDNEGGIYFLRLIPDLPTTSSLNFIGDSFPDSLINLIDHPAQRSRFPVTVIRKKPIKGGIQAMPLTTDERMLTLSRDVIQAFDKADGGIHPGFRPAHAKGVLLT